MAVAFCAVLQAHVLFPLRQLEGAVPDSLQNTQFKIAGRVDSLSQQNLHEYTLPISLDEYQLVWNDEFNDTTLSMTKWQYQTANAGWVNHERQTYVAGWSPQGRKTVEVSDGTLRINAFQEDDKIYSARIYAGRNTGWKYGYFEARIKLPKGKGTWPAFWMMPVTGGRWPACGEIDIMEEVGVDAGDVVSTIHCQAYNHTKGTQKSQTLFVPTSESSFHVYGMEWTKDYLQMYVDGHPSLRFPNDGAANDDTWPYNKAFYLILNLAWGGDWGGYAGVDDSALPITMEVDYVRVYQKK